MDTLIEKSYQKVRDIDMKQRRYHAAFFGLVFVVHVTCIQAQAYQCFRPGKLWFDTNGTIINAHGGGILFHEGTYYWFGEYKGEDSNEALVGITCYSSTDLYNWTFEKIALTVSDDKESPIVKGCIMERPKVVYNTGTQKFVMWFHLEPKGAGYTGAKSGLAVSDAPAGPYTFIEAIRPEAGFWPMNYPDSLKTAPVRSNDRYSGGSLPAHPDSLNIVARDFVGGQMARDMTLFVDDDGKAYHIYASEDNSTLHISLLSVDYCSHVGVYCRAFVGRFMEAPAMFKKDGLYYLIMSGCTGWAPNAGRSAVASNIFGPWKELGNPFLGDDSDKSFHSQSTYVLPVQGKKNAFLYMGDRWIPSNPIDGRYIWLPIQFIAGAPVLEWKDRWLQDDL